MTGPSAALRDSFTFGPVRRLWDRLQARFRPAPIATADSFRTFIEQRAALIAQKCAVDYCRGKTGAFSHTLFKEEAFVKALAVCRWETFAAVLGDLLIVAEGYLRPQASDQPHNQLCRPFIALYASILESQPLPEHRAQGWADAVEAFARRLKAAAAGAPRRALDVADHSARRLFDTLPIHSNLRTLDEEVVFGAVRFRMAAVSQEMERRFTADLVKALLASAPP